MTYRMYQCIELLGERKFLLEQQNAVAMVQLLGTEICIHAFTLLNVLFLQYFLFYYS